MADFSIKAELKANASQFVTEFKKGEAGVNSLGSVVEKILGPKGKLIMALSAATTAAIKFGQSMNASMSEIAKGTGATGEELYKLRQNVHSALINGVGRSAKEVGTMIADLNTRFGVTGEELTTLTGEFDKFAEVTDTDTKTAINLVADAMAKWDIEVEDTDKLLDQLTKASQLSGAGVTELTNGLKEGQAIFSQFGMSATDTIAFMGALKQNGIESSQALIAMKTALANFANAGIDAQEGFTQVSEAIRNATSQTEALSIATATFGARNGAEMVKVLQSGALSADEFKEKLMLAGGTVEDTEKASRTSKDAIEDFISVIKGSFGGLVEGIDTLFRGLFDVLAEIFQTLSPIIEPVMNIVRDILSFIGDLGASLAEMLTDVVENTLGFAQLTTALEDFHETIHNILANVLETFKTAFSLIFNIITGQWELAWLDCQKIVLTLGQSILDTISDLINAFKDQINVLIEKVLNPLIDKINWVQEKLKKPVTEKLQPFKDLDLSELTGLEDALEKVNKKIQDASGKSTKKVIGDLGKIQKATKKTATQAQKEEQETTETEDKEAQKRRDIAESTAKMKNDLINGVSQTYGSMFSMLGEEMVKGEAGWEDYAAVAVQGVAQVLQALGSELLALSAVRAAHFDYGTAAVAATAATAAFVSSGVLTAVSSAMKSSADTTDLATDSIDNWQSSIESLHDTITDLVESAVDFNGFITAVTQADDKIAAATSNYEKAIKQLENFAAELEILEGLIEIQNFSLFGGGDNWWDKLSHMQQLYLLAQQKKLQDQIKGTVKEIEEAERIIEDAIDTITGSVAEQNEELREQEELLKSIYSGEWLGVGKVITEQQQLLHLNESLVSTLAEFVNLGADIGDTLLDSLNDSLSSTEFLSTIKKTIRTNLLKIAVYTDEMRAKLAKVGTKLAEALSGQTSLKEVRNELNAIWEEAAKNAEKAEKIINEAFGDIADDIDDATEEITDALTTFEDAMQNFFTSIKDTGASIANEIVNGLTNGLSQSDFLSKMQTWLRNNLIQMVVYTDSMKSEIQAISDKIAEIMGSGRMFTTDELQEIRRDLSYAYESATARMGTIDEILNSVFSEYATGTQNVTALGETIGTTIISGLENGLGSVDFLNNMKKIIRSNLLKVAVYTESFQNRLASVGVKLASALSGESSLTNITVELQELWDIASNNAKKAEKIIEEAFGSTQDIIDDSANGIEDSINGVEEVLTSFEQAMQKFFTSIKDTGASIANEIVNGLTSGLSQSDFLSKMQTWLRNNLIQMVVYTDSMKSEIQAISDKIAEIMGSGRMFTTDELHEIRRDLSYAYESATARMGTIDEILNSVFSGYATGTQSATAGLHLVGEAGPELVRFRGGEQVFNANDTRDILSGGNMGNNFNVTFVNTQDTTAMAMMNQLRRYNRELAINGIL